MGMTFNMFYIGSKYPYFISYRGKWVYLFYRRYSCKSFNLVEQIDDQTEAEELVNAMKKSDLFYLIYVVNCKFFTKKGGRAKT